MIKLYCLMFVVLTLNSCTDVEKPSCTIITEYKNEYIKDTLLSRVVAAKYADYIFESGEETLYEYDDSGRCVSKKMYDITYLDVRTLFYIETYNGDIKEKIYLDGNDTTSYSLYDSHCLLRSFDKRNVVIEEYDIYMNDDYETISTFNENDRYIEEIKYDYILDEATRTLFFYDSIGVDRQIDRFSSSLKKNITNIVEFEKRQEGDTLIESMYENDKLKYIYQDIIQDDYELYLSYDSLSVLNSKREVIKNGDSTIEVDVRYDLVSIDSSYYVKGLNVRNIIIYDNSKTEEILEYDERGNILKETQYMYFYDDSKEE